MSRGVSCGCGVRRQPRAVFPGLHARSGPHARLRGGLGRGLAGVALLVTGTIVLGACGAASTTGPGGRSLPGVTIDATGCEAVRGLGTTRWVARSPGFWPVLGTALHLAEPDYATFRGSGPGG